MIVELLLDAIYGVLYALSIIFPDVEFPWTDELDDLAILIGTHLGGVNEVFPVAELVTVISWCAGTLLPVFLTFVVVRWVYAHVPVIGSGA